MGFLVMQIFVYQIHETFESIDVDQLQAAPEVRRGLMGNAALRRAPGPVAPVGGRSRSACGPTASGWARSARCCRSSRSGRRCALAGRVLAGEVPTWGPGEVLRADALSALLALCVAFVAALAAWLGPGLGVGRGARRRARSGASASSSNLFAFTMLAAVTTNNVAVMWVAIEATTITSAVLIPLHVSQGLGGGLVEVHPDRLGRASRWRSSARCSATSTS